MVKKNKKFSNNKFLITNVSLSTDFEKLKQYQL